jgi:hypothetical protein
MKSSRSSLEPARNPNPQWQAISGHEYQRQMTSFKAQSGLSMSAKKSDRVPLDQLQSDRQRRIHDRAPEAVTDCLTAAGRHGTYALRAATSAQ